MTDLAFVDDETELAPDEAPPTEDTGHYCLECGKPVTRNGTRGRWPSYCDEHAKSGRASGKRVPKSAGAQAKRAAAVLGNMNGMIAGILALPIPGNPIYLPETASALATKSDVFESQAAAALENDPELCRMILRGGTMGGRAALVMAYGMLAGSLLTVAIPEWKNRNTGD